MIVSAFTVRRPSWITSEHTWLCSFRVRTIPSHILRLNKETMVRTKVLSVNDWIGINHTKTIVNNIITYVNQFLCKKSTHYTFYQSKLSALCLRPERYHHLYAIIINNTLFRHLAESFRPKMKIWSMFDKISVKKLKDISRIKLRKIHHELTILSSCFYKEIRVTIVSDIKLKGIFIGQSWIVCIS